ncbi:TonB-dependent receptor, partial [uncultured Bacteroides sp.]
PSVGTITDMDGRFILNASAKDVLIISFVGYNTQEFPLNGKTNITVSLSQNVNELEGVEVVAFGTQKKESVIGSITTLSPKSLRVPSSNMTTALAGQVAGLISYQTSGEPGADDATFFVRGIASFGFNTSPLILIDNIESTSTDLGRLNPDDIESFSIMKDAMATALYGSRGANGVVLVKTKEGERGKTKFDVRVEGSNSRPTSNIELADPISYMKLHNEAILTRDPLSPVMYSDDKIDRTVPGLGSVIYPYTDWKKQLMKNSAWNGRANMSISGGGNAATYYVSLRYTKDQGLLNVDGKNNFNNNINLQTYQMRANVNINVTKTTQVRVNLSGIFDDYEGPIYSGSDIYSMVMKANPVLFPAVYPTDKEHQYIKHILFGNSDDGSYINPYAEMVKGYKDYENTTMLATLGITQDLDFLTKGLKFEGFFNISRKSYYSQTRQYKPYYYALSSYDFMTGNYSIENINPDSGTEYLDFGNGDKTVNNVMTIETRTNYNRDFGNHRVGGLIVTQYIDSKNPNYTTLQESLPSRNFGVSGRFTYAYADRYFSEFNFGLNGSERFDKEHRWGFFPSVGGGWMISNEPFFESLSHKIDKLKIRASYGLVGNDKIGDTSQRFLYLSNVNMNSTGASFGYENGYSRPGVSVSRYANPAIGWEKAYKANYALEASFYGFDLIAEYFTERRTSILQKRESIPGVMGYEVNSYANIGETKGHGVDLDLKYNKNISKDCYVIARGNFTYAHSEYLKYEDNTYDKEWWKYKIGYSPRQQWGYIAEGLFIDDAEVANSPVQTGNYQAGDIKFRDMNGDGVINSLDEVPIGYPTTPEINYGFGATFGYKGFDVNFQFHGSAHSSFWIDYEKMSPFFQSTVSGQKGNNQLAKFIADSYWSESNRDRYATWPRLSTTSIANNKSRSTWFMRDGSFLRLKLVEMGYTVPQKLVRKWGMSNLRFYMSSTNLFVLSKFKEWDVELAGNGLNYPLQRVFNIGVSVGF